MKKKILSMSAICAVVFAFVLTGCGPNDPSTFTVKFNSQGGSEVADITNVAEGATITKPTDPTKEGFAFDGWYREAACINAWNFASDAVNADITLYAKWELFNAYTYDGKMFNAVWAGYFHNEASKGYCFGISPVVLVGGNLCDEPNFFEVDYPEDRLGEKLDMSQDCNGMNWAFFGFFYLNGTEYLFGNYSYGVSGTDNWVKVTKNSGADNFTLEFAMTIGGKRLEGNYTGIFQKYDNYENVGLDW